MDVSLLESEPIKQLKDQVRTHKIYQVLTNLDNLRKFMGLHVFAVWDFMSLLKSLQKDLCGTSLPWTPSPHPRAARFINQLMIDEETDLGPGGNYLSHFELYLQAMAEIGSDTGPVLEWIHGPAVRQMRACSWSENQGDLSSLTESLPDGAKEFVYTTLQVLAAPLPVRAAVFFHGREDVIPGMFLQVVQRTPSQGLGSCHLFVDYLKRHITMDQEVHGPLAQGLLTEIFENQTSLIGEAQKAIVAALRARLSLWDAVVRIVS